MVMKAKTKISSKLIKSMVVNRHKSTASIDDKLKLKTTTISALCENDQEVEYGDILKMAKYFKKTWSYMLLDREEILTNLGEDHRTHGSMSVGFSSDMINETVWADNFISDALELAKALGKSSEFRLPASHKANYVRDFLGISVDDVSKIKDGYTALKTWISSIENTGIFVAQRNIPDKTIRAYSVKKNGVALMVLSTKDKPEARIFSLFHEYYHILLNNAGICDFDDTSNVEAECNKFAADFLMPVEELKNVVSGYIFGNDIINDEAKVRKMCRYFMVSQAAMLIRLNELSIISKSEYNNLERERSERKSTKKSTGGDYYKAHINAVGTMFSLNVIEALSLGIINRRDTSALLGVGEYSIPRYENALMEKAT
jgi:Zn-dependent peptidase ImmA (M78 family)